MIKLNATCRKFVDAVKYHPSAQNPGRMRSLWIDIHERDRNVERGHSYTPISNANQMNQFLSNNSPNFLTGLSQRIYVDVPLMSSEYFQVNFECKKLKEVKRMFNLNGCRNCILYKLFSLSYVCKGVLQIFFLRTHFDAHPFRIAHPPFFRTFANHSYYHYFFTQTSLASNFYYYMLWQFSRTQICLILMRIYLEQIGAASEKFFEPPNFWEILNEISSASNNEYFDVISKKLRVYKSLRCR